MKVKVSEAKGRVLDYLVAQAAGMKIYRSKSGRWMTANYGEFNHRHGTPWFEPTISWKYGGHLIEREGIELVRGNDLYFPKGNENGEFYEPLWIATRTEGPAVSEAWGTTPLIAVMRCYVASKLGDEVEVPNELA